MIKEEREKDKKFDKALADKISKVQIYKDVKQKKKSNIGRIFLLLILIIIIAFLLI